MTKTDATRTLLKSISDFKDAYVQLLNTVTDYEAETGKSVNDLKWFVDRYPFDCSLDELPILSWVNGLDTEIDLQNFKVLNYTYLNTGGNMMVGIFTVWLPEENRTVYALTNEEGCNLATVDYISNDLNIDDYDELIFDSCMFDTLYDTNKYFELYCYCLNEYTKSDCRYFGCERSIPYHLLSDELQSKVDAGYLTWLDHNNNGCVPTDGVTIIVHPDYELIDTSDTERQLQEIKDFKEFHDTTAGVEDFYSEEYVLTFAGKTIRLPFMADVWDAVDDLLRRTIEEW